MDIGQLRHRVTILTPVTARNTVGEDTDGWNPAMVVWASVKPMSGKLLEQTQGGGGTVASTATHQIVMRYTPLMTIDCRLQYGDSPARIFTVNDVRDIEERRVMLMITATELKQ